LDYLYNIKKIDELEIGDIIFMEVDENNRPICEYIILENLDDGYKSTFCLEEKSMRKLDFNDMKFVYFLGNMCQKLSI